jgi:hypothetical protein
MNHIADMRKKVSTLRLTRRERLQAAWYAVIIFAPVIAVILAHQLYAPSLSRIMGWPG